MTKRSLYLFLALLLAVVGIGSVTGLYSQSGVPGTLVQNSPTELRASSVQCTATGAGNTTVTCTLGPPPGGQYVYITNCTVHEVANAAITGAAAPAGVLTTTNLGTNQIWWADNATQGTGWQKEVMKESWPWGLKTAQSGTSFTLAQTGGQSTQSFRINCSGYYAP